MFQTTFASIVRTTPDLGLLVLRLLFAAVIWPHGAQKLLGWFGGYGYRGTMGYFTGTVGAPAPLGFTVIMLEFFGPVALALGFLSRPVALGLAAVMIVAALRVHLPNGFFMNWFGDQKGEGFEYFVLGAAIAVAIVIGGSGAFSVDYHLARWI